MTSAEPQNEIAETFHFRITPQYITSWMHKFEHWESNEKQQQTITALSESLYTLLRKRDQIQSARGVFGPVSIYYPNAHPTPRQQEDLFEATQEFFSAYYSAVSNFASLIKRHWNVFGDAPHGSISKFLKWWKDNGLFMDEAYPLLESARAFRAMLSHTEAHPTYDWQTLKDEVFTKIILVGAPNEKGKIPAGTEPCEDKWYLVAPDEDLIVSALAVQLNAAIPAIQGSTEDGIANEMRCTWQLPATPDDIPGSLFPIFAHQEGVVKDLITQTVQTEVNVTTSSGEQIVFDQD